MEAGMVALTIRRDRTPAMLRRVAKSESDPRVSRRLLAIANALSGMDRKTAAEAAGMERQALRDCVVRYNAEGLDGLRDRWAKGRPGRLEPHEQAELAAIVLRGPAPEIDGISAYTLEDLAHFPGAFRQTVPSGFHEPGGAAARFFPPKGEAKPPAKRPGLTGGL